jgi:hypothetical protein
MKMSGRNPRRLERNPRPMTMKTGDMFSRIVIIDQK